MMQINIIAEGHQATWMREKSHENPFDFCVTPEPVSADWHVVYNVLHPILLPNHISRIIFVAVEPPEMEHYDPKVLNKYRAVISPGFRYLTKSLPNHFTRTGLLNWRIDISYENQPPDHLLSREELVGLKPPTGEKISVITSSKKITPLHRQRLRLIDYLAKKMPELVVYGAGHQDIRAKIDALTQNRYHLALENAIHPHFWSEKLADPLLGLNQVFHGGHPTAKEDFPGKAVSTVNPWKKDETYRKIISSIESTPYDSVLAEIRAHQANILNRLNIFCVLNEVIRKLEPDTAEASNTASTYFPSHKKFGLRTRVARLR